MLRFFKRVNRRDLCRDVAAMKIQRDVLRRALETADASHDDQRETITGLENEIAIAGRELSAAWADHCAVVDGLKQELDVAADVALSRGQTIDRVSAARNAFRDERNISRKHADELRVERNVARKSRDEYAKDVIELGTQRNELREMINKLDLVVSNRKKIIAEIKTDRDELGKHRDQLVENVLEMSQNLKDARADAKVLATQLEIRDAELAAVNDIMTTIRRAVSYSVVT